MSAHKRTTITISEEEYRKLHEAAMRKRFLEKDLPTITGELRKETQQSIKRSMLGVEKRQEQYQHVLGNMQREIRDSEMRTTQIIANQEYEFWQTIEDFAGNLWNETTTRLINDREELFSKLREENYTKQQEISQIRDEIRSVQGENYKRNQFSEQWIKAAVDLRDFIDLQYDHEKFTPGELTSCEDLQKRAEENLSLGFAESALTFSQQAFYNLSNLRISLEQRVSDWEAKYAAVIERARQLIRLIERNQVSPAIDLNGKELDLTIDVDQWTDGALSKRIDFLMELIEQVENHGEMLETEKLNNLLEETFPDIQSELEESIQQARLMVLNSQIRVNIADLVLQALQDQGYAFEQSGYVNSDMRFSYLASTKSMDGGQIIIQVDPIEGTGAQNELHIHTLGEEKYSHHELRQRAKEINRSLANHGLQVGATKTQPSNNQNLVEQLNVSHQIKEQKVAYRFKRQHQDR